jgi:hypothetical protein
MSIEINSKPSGNSTDQIDQPVYSGPAIAATLAPVLGFFTLMTTHHISRLTKDLDKLIHSYGYWIPGSTGVGPDGSIGSYSGKETLAIIIWLVSWGVFHVLWKKQNISIKKWLPIFLGLIVLVTLGFFHPLADPIVLLIAGLFG